MVSADDGIANELTRKTFRGDTGRTLLGGHGEVSKTDVRVAAYADCDEANSAVSVAIAGGALPNHVTTMLASVQNDLFDLVTDLSTPLAVEGALARIQEAHIERLERAVDHFVQEASDLSGKILPGGTLAASLLYQARVVVRRAERSVWTAIEAYPDQLNPLTARYLNRLSLLLFVIARGANAEHGDVLWVPEASARAMAGEPVEPPEE
ncbi:MAG TPA: cob(I)yrinic acid a,c-diamide adenosyltransferase [Homoserinimonas sp.]|nr:cob(I)yrinic acid a,c-diamide adenosyltransferase [Homoserinimonas sp.]